MNFKILTIAALALMPLQQAFSMPIDSVSVNVVDIRGDTSGPLLRKMGSSMQVVAKQILADKDTEIVRLSEVDYTRLLTEIGDRVLTGYEISNTYMTLGPTTYITLEIYPWNNTIENVDLDIQFSGVEPAAAELLEERMPQLKNDLLYTISGASVDASDWAVGVLRRIVRDEVENALPEFKAAVDLVQEGDRTVVQVVIYPVGQLVRTINYELRSEAIPNLLLMKLKNKYRVECDKLRGLPVEHVKRNRDEITGSLRAQLEDEADGKLYRLKPKVSITPGPDTDVEILLTSNEYKIWFEGYGDVGRDKNNLSGKAHVGRFLLTDHEVFGEAEVYLNDMDWIFGLGYTYHWGKSAWTYARRIPKSENDWKFEYYLGPRWRLRTEHFSGSNRNEYGVRYHIHEFLSAEAVYGGDEFYLRLIGNL
ncbi:MAG: hypothetical protein LUD41_08015 [Phascolarctobacterium sp.]|nr:hypothetical protein [Phascolarctobacterium sp.]